MYDIKWYYLTSTDGQLNLFGLLIGLKKYKINTFLFRNLCLSSDDFV